MLALRSGLSDSMCDHIRSTSYCSKTATEEWLLPEVLDEMLAYRFFSDPKAALCSKRQREAEEAHVRLCVSVDFYSSKSKLCFSISEPKLSCHSTLGRVIVTKTWSCSGIRKVTYLTWSFCMNFLIKKHFLLMLNHMTISRVVSCLETLDETKFPSTGRILHGYCHFEALVMFPEYTYTD